MFFDIILRTDEFARIGNEKQFVYDALSRLKSASGSYRGGVGGVKTANYALSLEYDALHNITRKMQSVEQNNMQFTGTLKAGYDLRYTYDRNPQQIGSIVDSSYRSTGAIQKTEQLEQFTYDGNGNMVALTGSERAAGGVPQMKSRRLMLWDEDNHLLSINDNGFVSNYWYDASGDRTLKVSGRSEGVFVNGLLSGSVTETSNFTAYVSPYVVVGNGGRLSKHIYAGTQRVASSLCDLTVDPTSASVPAARLPLNAPSYASQYSNQLSSLKNRYDSLGVSYAGTDRNGQSGVLSAASGTTSNTTYYYHPDHLGSSSLITDAAGNMNQHIEYVPFGEVFVEEHKNGSWSTPYKFNAKELDEETGLYYYIARYYDPRLSVWLSVDPLAEKYPNVSSYVYCLNNPVKFVDPDGRDWLLSTGNKTYWYGGKYGDKSELINTYNSTSGSKNGIHRDPNGQQYHISLQNSRYQYVKNGGPTVEGKYKLNLKPDPEVATIKNRVIQDGKGKGIQLMNGMTDSDVPGMSFSSPDWGNMRINLIPVDVKQPAKNLSTPSTDDDRDLGSFYYHDSTKGQTSGCHEIESRFFNDLLNYRQNGNNEIEVKIQYPSSNHSTNGGTENEK